MPGRNDTQSILTIDTGPIVIGQGCDFDYFAVQACKILRAEANPMTLNPPEVSGKSSLTS